MRCKSYKVRWNHVQDLRLIFCETRECEGNEKLPNIPLQEFYKFNYSSIALPGSLMASAESHPQQGIIPGYY